MQLQVPLVLFCQVQHLQREIRGLHLQVGIDEAGEWLGKTDSDRRQEGYDKVEFEVKDLEVFIEQFAHFYILFWNSLKNEKTHTRIGEDRNKRDTSD